MLNKLGFWQFYVIELLNYSGSVNSELRTIYIMLLVCHSRSSCFGSSTCQNLTPRNPDLPTSLLLWGYACYYCCMPSSPSCLAAYILPSSSVSLHINILSSSPVLHILHLFLYFLALSSLHPSTF